MEDLNSRLQQVASAHSMFTLVRPMYSQGPALTYVHTTCIYVYIHAFMYTCLYRLRHIYLSICLSVCVSAYPSTCPSTSLSIGTCLSIYPSISLSLSLSVSLWRRGFPLCRVHAARPALLRGEAIPLPRPRCGAGPRPPTLTKLERMPQKGRVELWPRNCTDTHTRYVVYVCTYVSIYLYIYIYVHL